MRAAGSELARKPTSKGGSLRFLIPSETSLSRFLAMLPANITLQCDEGDCDDMFGILCTVFQV